MPPKPLFDFSALDLSKVTTPREEIYKVNPHQHEFQMLDGIFFIDRKTGTSAGYRDVRDDEFWVRGHIPGRPIFPGVLMIETAAHLVSYYAMTATGRREFLGFAGVQDVRFRGVVVPGQRIIMIGKMLELRPRRCIGATQAFVNGEMVYQGVITGMWM
ncbi:MAG TPA: 3-hydroxyacyl-ACP dehydratase FabZ family protein [Phycisphaerae bacterium]|nr:3-hydroxyacyl-ACP dehydratase FabZ family protein [Phycisphaerae bacterium]HUT59363.1 3-hydroxyacyl-ACP dehydratase FabZ family protein [Phycisphaerae bacterium]